MHLKSLYLSHIYLAIIIIIVCVLTSIHFYTITLSESYSIIKQNTNLTINDSYKYNNTGTL